MLTRGTRLHGLIILFLVTLCSCAQPLAAAPVASGQGHTAIGASTKPNQPSAAGDRWVCRDDDPELGDLSDPGLPAEATLFESPDIAGVLLERPNDFYVYRRVMHARLVTLAFDKNLPLDESQRAWWSEYLFESWALFWSEYGGFPYPSYTYVFGYDLPYAEVGAFGLGSQTQYLRTDWATHGMYHGWCGCSYRQQAERSWFTEGVTMYYANVRRQREYRYTHILGSFVLEYLDWYDSGQDRVIGNMSMLDDDYWHHFVAIKGCLIAYLLDKELAQTRHHIGEVARLLYQRYGINSVGTPTNEQILAAFNEVSGQDYSEFFRRYIDGNEQLPVAGEPLEWVCHDWGLAHGLYLPAVNRGWLPPQLAIATDGLADDLQAYQLVGEDPQGDSLGDGHSDLKALYTAQDEGYAYWMLQVHEPPVDRSVSMHMDGPFQHADGTWRRLSVSTNEYGADVRVDQYDDNWVPVQMSVSYASKDVIEIRLPLAPLGNPLRVEIAYASLAHAGTLLDSLRP